MKRALIIGASGQDGTLLARLLKQKGYNVTGLSRQGSHKSCDQSVALDVRDNEGLRAAVCRVKPLEIYYLAAYHRSSQGAAKRQDEATTTFDVNLRAYIAVLEESLKANPPPRVFYACTSLIFSGPGEVLLTEESAMSPQCLYSISKQAGRTVSEYFRDSEGLHVSVGILFNHESTLRSEQFLSRRIVKGIRAIHEGRQRDLVIGDLRARCDWGYAGDYVDAMWRMLQQDRSETYIVASGALHTPQDWVQRTCELAGLEPGSVIREDLSLLTRRRPALLGDNAKLRRQTGWEPATSFEQMVGMMYREEL